MSSQIEGTQSSLNDLLLYEMDGNGRCRLGRLAGSATQILEALFLNPVINIVTLKQHTGITPATIGKVLDAMEQQLGMVRELTGQKRHRIYAYTAYITILNQELN